MVPCHFRVIFESFLCHFHVIYQLKLIIGNNEIKLATLLRSSSNTEQLKPFSIFFPNVFNCSLLSVDNEPTDLLTRRRRDGQPFTNQLIGRSNKKDFSPLSIQFNSIQFNSIQLYWQLIFSSFSFVFQIS